MRDHPIVGKDTESEALYTLEFEKASWKNGLRPLRKEEADLGVDVTVEALLDPGEHGREASGVFALFQLKVANPSPSGSLVARVKKSALGYPGYHLGAAFIVGWHAPTGTFHAVTVQRAVESLDARSPNWRDGAAERVDVALEVPMTDTWLQDVRARLLRHAPLVAAVSAFLSAGLPGGSGAGTKPAYGMLGPMNAELQGDSASRDAEARQLLVEEKFEAALDALTSLIADVEAGGIAYPRKWALYSNLGLAYVGLKRLGEASGAFERATTIGPAEPTVWVNLGFASLNLGDVTRAEQCLTQIPTAREDHPSVWNLRAVVASVRGKSNEAITLYDEGLKRHPTALVLHRGLASEYLDRGELDKVRQVVERGLEACRGDPGLGWLRYLLGEVEFAMAIAELGGTRTESGPEQYVLSFAVPQGTKFAIPRALEAAEHFKVAIDSLGAKVRGCELQLAGSLALGGRYEEAIRTYERLFDDPKHRFQARGGAAHCLVQLNRHRDAIPILTDLLDAEPTNLRLLNMKAICHLEQGESELAGQAFQRAAEQRGSGELDAQNYIAWCVRSGELDKAVAFIRTRVAENPQEFLPHQWLYEVGTLRGDHSAQIDALRGVMRLRPQSISAAVDLFLLLLRLGRLADATEALQGVKEDGLPPFILLALSGVLGHLRRWNDAARVAGVARRLSTDPRQRIQCNILIARALAHRRVTFVTPSGLQILGDPHNGAPFVVQVPPQRQMHERTPPPE